VRILTVVVCVECSLNTVYPPSRAKNYLLDDLG